MHDDCSSPRSSREVQALHKLRLLLALASPFVFAACCFAFSASSMSSTAAAPAAFVSEIRVLRACLGNRPHAVCELLPRPCGLSDHMSLRKHSDYGRSKQIAKYFAGVLARNSISSNPSIASLTRIRGTFAFQKQYKRWRRSRRYHAIRWVLQITLSGCIHRW